MLFKKCKLQLQVGAKNEKRLIEGVSLLSMSRE